MEIVFLLQSMSSISIFLKQNKAQFSPWFLIFLGRKTVGLGETISHVFHENSTCIVLFLSFFLLPLNFVQKTQVLLIAPANYTPLGKRRTATSISILNGINAIAFPRLFKPPFFMFFCTKRAFVAESYAYPFVGPILIFIRKIANVWIAESEKQMVWAMFCTYDNPIQLIFDSMCVEKLIDSVTNTLPKTIKLVLFFFLFFFFPFKVLCKTFSLFQCKI